MSEDVKAPEATEGKKKKKKLSKVVEGSVITIVEAVTGTTLKFDVNTLPEAIQTNLKYHGASQKLGDAAAGREGQEAVNAINKVWEGLAKGDWSVRAPAAEKVSIKDLAGKVAAMADGKDKKMAEELLRKLGILK